MFSLKPKEEKFFELFREGAGIVKEGSQLMQNMMSCYECMEDRLAELLKLQKRGDEVTETIIRRLDETFITPFDREDIYSLARGLDEILDAICSSVDKMVLYQIGKPLEEFQQMVEVFGKNTETISETVLLLRDIKKNYSVIMENCQEIKRLESEGDHLYRLGVARIMRLEPIYGFASDTASSLVIVGASFLGAPVSTTHVVSSAIMGVGSTKRLTAVRWGVALNIVSAWVMTAPISAMLGAVFYLLASFIISS
ncbi:MAG: DUF47 family protein [Eubacteriales bacterium]